MDAGRAARHVRRLEHRAARLPEAGFEPRVAYTSDDYFAIQGLVASGMGVALVPGLALISTREDVAVRPLRGRPPYRRIGAVFPADPVGPVAVMVDCLRDAAEEYKRLAPVSAVAGATVARGGKREVRRRGWGTATTPYIHVAAGRATAGEERGASRGRSAVEATMALP